MCSLCGIDGARGGGQLLRPVFNPCLGPQVAKQNLRQIQVMPDDHLRLPIKAYRVAKLLRKGLSIEPKKKQQQQGCKTTSKLRSSCKVAEHELTRFVPTDGLTIITRQTVRASLVVVVVVVSCSPCTQCGFLSLTA